MLEDDRACNCGIRATSMYSIVAALARIGPNPSMQVSSRATGDWWLASHCFSRWYHCTIDSPRILESYGQYPKPELCIVVRDGERRDSDSKSATSRLFKNKKRASSHRDVGENTL